MGYNNIFSNENNQANNAYHKSFQPICDGFFALGHYASWILHARRRPARISKLMHQKNLRCIISRECCTWYPSIGDVQSCILSFISASFFLLKVSMLPFLKILMLSWIFFTQTWNSTSAMTHEQVCKWANPCDGSSNTRMYLFPDCCARCR